MSYQMKGTDTNFDKVRETTVESWKELSKHKKLAYWELHREYPKEHLLDDVESELELDDKKVKLVAKKTEAERVRNERIKAETKGKKSQLLKNKKIITKQEKELESSTEMINYLEEELEELKDAHLNEKGRLEKKIKNLKKELATKSSRNELEILKLKLKVSERDNEILKHQSKYETLEEECSYLDDTSEELKEKNEKLEHDLEKMKEKYHAALLKVRD